MGNDLNYNCFTGRLGADPESRFLPNGDAVTNFTIAVGSQWRDKSSGEKVEKTEWVRCCAFRKTAELIVTHLKKGSRALIQGKQQTRSWDNAEGKKQYMTECIVDNVIFLDSKGDSQGYDKPQEPPGGIDPDGEPIPF